MMLNLSKNIISIFLIVFVYGCGDKITSPAVPHELDFSITPMENAEAELIALHLSGELIAPIKLYNKVSRELRIIREDWQDSIQYVNLQFLPFYKVSTLLMAADSIVFDSIVDGTYKTWDSLNSYFRLDRLYGIFRFNEKIYFQLNFIGRLNSFLLKHSYEELPYILGVGWLPDRPGDYPLLVPIKYRNGIKYFFRHGYGDCPSGCLNADVYYFTVEKGSAIYHGFYSYQYPHFEPIPTWLDTFELAYSNYNKVH